MSSSLSAIQTHNLHNLLSKLTLSALLFKIPAISHSLTALSWEILHHRNNLILQLSPSGPYFCSNRSCICKPYADNETIPWSSFHLHFPSGTLPSPLIDKLVSNLPAIQGLFLHLERLDPETTSQLIRLLNTWPLAILTVKFPMKGGSFHIENDPGTEAQLRRLLAVIGQSTSLQMLSFQYPGYLLPRGEPDAPQIEPLDLPVLNRLDFFSLKSHDRGDLLLGTSYSRYLPGAPAGLRSLEHAPISPTGLPTILQYPAETAERFFALNLKYVTYGLSRLTLNYLVDLFTNLTIIWLPLNNPALSLPRIIRTLDRLRTLQVLMLSFGDANVQIAAVEEFGEGPHGMWMAPHVTHLYLIDFTYQTHGDLERLQLHRLLPGLTAIYFNRSGHRCVVCQGEAANGDGEEAVEVDDHQAENAPEEALEGVAVADGQLPDKVFNRCVNALTDQLPSLFPLNSLKINRI